PPNWFLKLKGRDKDLRGMVCKPWIHGVGDAEQQIFVPLSSIEGHNLIFGTTGSGKTRLYENLITQAVWRDEVVIVIDPKGDKEFEDICEKACIAAGRPEAFIRFHPGFPTK